MVRRDGKKQKKTGKIKNKTKRGVSAGVMWCNVTKEDPGGFTAGKDNPFLFFFLLWDNNKKTNGERKKRTNKAPRRVIGGGVYR